MYVDFIFIMIMNTQINKHCLFSRLWCQQNVSTCFPLSSQSKLMN